MVRSKPRMLCSAVGEMDCSPGRDFDAFAPASFIQARTHRLAKTTAAPKDVATVLPIANMPPGWVKHSMIAWLLPKIGLLAKGR